MLHKIIKTIVGTKNDRVLKSMAPLVQKVNALEPEFQKLTDDQLKAKTAEFKSRIDQGETLDELLFEAFATVREAALRTLGMRHYDVQLIGGAILHQGTIAEMKTGEGKTLVATLAAYLNALPGKGVHVVTVNDYLARRDAEWMSKVYNFLDMSVGIVCSGMDDDEKLKAYKSDITYAQNTELGFDYLRDNMKFKSENLALGSLNYAIVDEVDSVLIDEARTPLIISGAAEDSTELYVKINKIAHHFESGKDFEIELQSKQLTLTEDGVARGEELLKIDNLYDPSNIALVHHLQQALKAHNIFEKNVDYLIKNGEVIIVDEFTGRQMPGRRWSDGLHQAVEAKEGMAIARENQTIASITYQNFFRLYGKLSGMTGTAVTEAAEFNEIYKLAVIVIPTNKPLLRDDESDVVFRTTKEKIEAVVEDIEENNENGQPVLVGTISIEQSETYSQMLSEKGISHTVLNAKHHESEAEIVSQAGRLGGVTIATNMAGRGTDIVLGGNPEALALAEVNEDDPSFNEVLSRYQEQCNEEKQQVLDAGGLFIMGTERHESRRIDNQLRGRSGRQGDPGLTRFYISLEDDLMKRFGGDKIQGLMKSIGWQEGVAMDGRLISRAIENAQSKVERLNFDRRKEVTKYDDVMNKQRQAIYSLRKRILLREDLETEFFNFKDDLVEDAVLNICTSDKKPINWNLDELSGKFEFLFNKEFKFDSNMQLDQQKIFDLLRKESTSLFESHKAMQVAELDKLKEKYDSELEVSITERSGTTFDFTFDTYLQHKILENIDKFWLSHLQQMDFLREGVGLRSYGQKNPLHEYQREGFNLFTTTLDQIKEKSIRDIFYLDATHFDQMYKHIQAELRRREALKAQLDSVNQSSESSDGSPRIIEAKDPESQKQKIQARKRARRKKKK